MSQTTTYVSVHEQRVQLVAQAITKNSKLGDKAATELAEHVLYALDHIPEKVRYYSTALTGRQGNIRRRQEICTCR